MNQLPQERDTEQLVRSWMRDHEGHAADRNRQVGRIMGRVDETHQRRGAWRLLPVGNGAKRVDEHDEELYTAGGGVVAARRSLTSAMAVAVVALLLVTGVALLAWLPRTAGTGAGASPTPTVHPEDVDLMAALTGVWSGERTSYADVIKVYDAQAVHTALWHDTVEAFVGQFAIWERIKESRSVNAPPGWVPLPPDPLVQPPERRYMSVTQNLGGIACIVAIRQERIIRHDCVLPTASTRPIGEWGPPAEDTLQVREDLWADFIPGWANRDPELINATVSPEIVHHVAYIGREETRTGIADYMGVMGWPEPESLADPIPLPAPAGEHRWTDYTDLAGGTLCAFWEHGGLIVRHDCIVPTY